MSVRHAHRVGQRGTGAGQLKSSEPWLAYSWRLTNGMPASHQSGHWQRGSHHLIARQSEHNTASSFVIARWFDGGHRRPWLLRISVCCTTRRSRKTVCAKPSTTALPMTTPPASLQFTAQVAWVQWCRPALETAAQQFRTSSSLAGLSARP